MGCRFTLPRYLPAALHHTRCLRTTPRHTHNYRTPYLPYTYTRCPHTLPLPRLPFACLTRVYPDSFALAGTHRTLHLALFCRQLPAATSCFLHTTAAAAWTGRFPAKAPARAASLTAFATATPRLPSAGLPPPRLPPRSSHGSSPSHRCHRLRLIHAYAGSTTPSPRTV